MAPTATRAGGRTVGASYDSAEREAYTNTGRNYWYCGVISFEKSFEKTWKKQVLPDSSPDAWIIQALETSRHNGTTGYQL